MIDSIRQFISDSLAEMDCDMSGIDAGLTVDEFCALVAERTQTRTLVE